MEIEATDKQISYLRQLGARIPAEGLTRREASDLIASTLAGRPPAEARDLALAARFGARATRFASKAAIFSNIVEHLYSAEEWDSLYRWFAWRVHRVTFDRGRWAGIDDPFDARLDAVVSDLVADEKWTASVRRASKFSASGFRWFGELHGSTGDSERTYAYERARRMILQAFPDPVRTAQTSLVERRRNPDRLEVAVSSAYRPLMPSDIAQKPREKGGYAGWVVPLAVIVAVLVIPFLLA